MEKNKIDILDEALRILYLEGSADDVKNLSRIQFIKGLPQMPDARKELLLSKLKSLSAVPTLGQAISEKLQQLNMQPGQLAESSSLPVRVVNDLIEDNIYTNNVPIIFFKNLLKKINISFTQAEKSIRKTFELLQSKSINPQSLQTFQPAFRKGMFGGNEDGPTHFHRSDGKELYENKEALDNYLNRLSELLND